MEDQLRRIKLVLLVSSLLALGLLLVAAYEENLRGEWRGYQRSYREALVQRATTPAQRTAAKRMPLEFQQSFLPALHRVDRCRTCHIGIDDPRMADAPQPLRTHSGKLFESHPPDKFGCTVCHDGQGRAVSRDAAHGEVKFWDSPLLRGERVYTSCGRCHYEEDLFGGGTERFARRHTAPAPIDPAELSAALPGAARISHGKTLVMGWGCLGCHQYRGRGGTVGPEISYIGDKSAHDFDFRNVSGPRTVEEWLFEHYKAPGRITPGTLMQDHNLSDTDARDLTLFTLNLHRKRFPPEYTPLPPRGRGEQAEGKVLFGMFCSACHGQGGVGGVANKNYVKGTIPALNTIAERMFLFYPEDAQAVIAPMKKGESPEGLSDSPPFPRFNVFLAQYRSVLEVIRKGNEAGRLDPKGPAPPLNMPAWGEDLSEEDVNVILAYLIGLEPWPQDQE